MTDLGKNHSIAVRVALAVALSTTACAGKTAPEVSADGHDPATKTNASTSEPAASSADAINTYAARETFDKATLPESKLTGTDKNKNDIRDDIEQYIDETYGEAPRDWLLQRQYARAYQRLLAYSNDKTSTLDAIEELFAAEACADVFDDDYRDKRNELKARILDTDERLDAYIAANVHASGQVFTPPGPSKTQCKFDTEDL